MERRGRSFERLHALVRKGYKPVLGTDDAGSDAVRLTHIARTHDLILHGSGAIEPVLDRLPRHKRRLPALADIGVATDADQVRFLQFVEAIPRPTLRDRTRKWRTRWVYGPLFLAVLWGLSLLFTVMISGGF